MSGTSMDIEKRNIEKLKELFPNVVTDGKVDFDILRTIFGGGGKLMILERNISSHGMVNLDVLKSHKRRLQQH